MVCENDYDKMFYRVCIYILLGTVTEHALVWDNDADLPELPILDLEEDEEEVVTSGCNTRKDR